MLTFPNITPEVFARVLDELRKHSTVTHLGGSGTSEGVYCNRFLMEGNGIQAETTHENGAVTVTVNHKPFYVSEGMIRGKIQDAIEVAQRELGQGGTA